MALRYERIADDIRHQIADGVLSAGNRLPAESALAPQYKVSVPTIRQALDVLQAEGLIERRHGSGTFVREPQAKIEYANARFWLGWDPRRVFGIGQDGDAASADDLKVTVEFREVMASSTLAARMSVQVGTRLVECEYRSRRLPAGSTYVVTRSYLLRSVLGGVPASFSIGGAPWGDEYRQLLSAAGVELNYVIERLSARPPSAEEAEVLGVSRGVAILALNRTSFDTDGRVAEVADIVMSGDRVDAIYTTTLRTPRAAPTEVGGYGDTSTVLN